MVMEENDFICRKDNFIKSSGVWHSVTADSHTVQGENYFALTTFIIASKYFRTSF